MKNVDFGRCALGLCVATALLAGCGGSQPRIGAPGAMSQTSAIERMARMPRCSRDYKVSAGLLYVALGNIDHRYDRVNVYNTKDKNPSPLAIITDGVSYPQDACTDSNGTLYVTNQGSGAGWISEYPLGKTKPSATITNGISGPGYCAIDGDGNLWVTNIYTPDVVEYQKGINLAVCDDYQRHNLPDWYRDRLLRRHLCRQPQRAIGDKREWSTRRSANRPARTITDGIEWPGGIGVDGKATLFVSETYLPGNVEEYRAGQNHPFREITKEMNGPVAVSFTKSGWMYITNVGAQSGGSGPPHTILEFPPGSMTPKKEISKDLYRPVGTCELSSAAALAPRRSAPLHGVRESGPCCYAGFAALGIAAWIGIAAAPAWRRGPPRRHGPSLEWLSRAPSSQAGRAQIAALAVANYEEESSGKGNVAVYPHATGSPAYYTATFSHYQSCAYDNEGNLLITDGFASGSDFAWLAKNGKKLVNIDVKGGSSEEGGFAGVQSIVWDGKYFVIDTSLGGGSAIYRISIKNKRGHTVGTTYLGGSAGTLGQLAIYNGNSEGAQVVGGGGETSESLVDYWKYPSGGSPLAQIANGLDGPFGVAISLKRRQ